MALRTSEIGVRIALGANSNNVLMSVMSRGLLLAAVGLTIGLAISLLVVRVLDSFLFETGVYDPVALIVAAFTLTVAALCASYLPARRATGVDPVEALRAE